MIAGVLLVTATTTVAQFTPARQLDGALPTVPATPTVAGWLEETIELTVDPSGAVSDVRALRGTTSASLPLMGPVIKSWRFRPASEARRPVSSHVLVAAVIRPPQLVGPALGAEPTTFAGASDEVPYPTAMRRPRYPPLAAGNAIVLVEVLVGPDGQVRAATIAGGRSASVFDNEALATARRWAFRPAQHNGERVSAYVYLVFGFRRF